MRRRYTLLLVEDDPDIRDALTALLSEHGFRVLVAGDGYEAIGGWRFGNTIDGAQAEYVRVPAAQANLERERPPGATAGGGNCTSPPWAARPPPRLSHPPC